MSYTLTIRARIQETIVDGVGVPTAVTITGAAGLSADAVWEIANEALHGFMGTYSHPYRPYFGLADLERARMLDPDTASITVRVDTLD